MKRKAPSLDSDVLRCSHAAMTGADGESSYADLSLPELPDSEEDAFADLLNREMGDLVITPEEWRAMHPAGLRCGSDRYYADLATKLHYLWSLMPQSSRFPAGVLRASAIALAAYMEDIVSGIGVWDAIRELHRRNYGTLLPFYDCSHEDYLPDNVNIEDISLLVWQVWCRCGKENAMVYSPYSQAIPFMSELAYDLLVDEFEKAPEAGRLADCIKRIFRKGDFFEVRSLQEWLVFSNPLTSQPGRYHYAADVASEVSGDKRLELNFDKAMYSQMCSMAVSRHVGPDGLKAADYLATMCEAKGFGDLAGKLRGQEFVSYGSFRLIDSDKLTLTLEDVTGTRYRVAKDSFGTATNFRTAKGFTMSLVRFGDLWQQNGMAIIIPEDPFKNKEALQGYQGSKKGVELAAETSARHRGRRIFYCRDSEELSRLLGIPCRKEVDVEEESEDLLILLSDIEGIVTLSGYACVVKDRANPLYDKSEAEAYSLELVASGLVPDDIAAIFQEKKMLPGAALACHQGKRFGRRVMQDNLRYFFAFYRSCRL